MTRTVIVRERVTRRQWVRDPLGVCRRVIASLGLADAAAVEVQVELVAPIHKHRRLAVLAVRVRGLLEAA